MLKFTKCLNKSFQTTSAVLNGVRFAFCNTATAEAPAGSLAVDEASHYRDGPTSASRYEKRVMSPYCGRRLTLQWPTTDMPAH